jgi:cystinosin
MSRLGAIASSSTCVLIAVLAGLCIVNKFFWLDFVYIMSYLKLITTVLKYIPQVYMNYALKSTIGWNIQNTLMDLVGGVLSVAQLIMDAFNKNDISGIKGYCAHFELTRRKHLLYVLGLRPS